MTNAQASSKIRKLLAEANNIASQIVEQKARQILLEHPNLDEFIMGMGGWFFTRKDKDHTGESMIIHECDTDECPKYMIGLQNFIDQWDNDLHVTGELMRFTAKGKKITEWGGK